MRRVYLLDVQPLQFFPTPASDFPRLVLDEVGRVQVADKGQAAVQDQRDAVVAVPGGLDDLPPDSDAV